MKRLKNPTVIFPRVGEVSVHDVDVPEAGRGQLLVRAEASVISSGTELTCLHGKFNQQGPWARWVKYPFSPGYSLVGKVEAVGPGVENFRPGQRVAVPSPHGRFVLAAAASAIPVLDGIPSEEAAWFNLASIAQTGIRRVAPNLGDQIAVIGLGVIGQLVIQYCRLLGARNVIAIGTHSARLDAARESGATTLSNCRAEQAAAKGISADIVFDATGNPECLSPALELVRPLGKLCLIGDAGFPEKQTLSPNFLTRGIELIASHDSNAAAIETHQNPWSVTRMQKLFLVYLARKEMKVSHLITDRFPVAKAKEAYRCLADSSSKSLGVILEY